MDEPRVYVAPPGTPLDGPGWTDIGTIADDGLDVEQEELIPVEWPFATRITLTGAARIAWGGYRWLFSCTSPAASRVKREYHRRRR